MRRLLEEANQENKKLREALDTLHRRQLHQTILQTPPLMAQFGQLAPSLTTMPQGLTTLPTSLTPMPQSLTTMSPSGNFVYMANQSPCFIVPVASKPPVTIQQPGFTVLMKPQNQPFLTPTIIQTQGGHQQAPISQ
nr:hypothetical protein [Macronycteris gammaherpesvirus 1]